MTAVVAPLPEAFRRAGGVQRYGRGLAKALAETTRGPRFLLLNDRLEDVVLPSRGGGLHAETAWLGRSDPARLAASAAWAASS